MTAFVSTGKRLDVLTLPVSRPAAAVMILNDRARRLGRRERDAGQRPDLPGLRVERGDAAEPVAERGERGLLDAQVDRRPHGLRLARPAAGEHPVAREQAAAGGARDVRLRGSFQAGLADRRAVGEAAAAQVGALGRGLRRADRPGDRRSRGAARRSRGGRAAHDLAPVAGLDLRARGRLRDPSQPIALAQAGEDQRSVPVHPLVLHVEHQRSAHGAEHARLHGHRDPGAVAVLRGSRPRRSTAWWPSRPPARRRRGRRPAAPARGHRARSGGASPRSRRSPRPGRTPGPCARCRSRPGRRPAGRSPGRTPRARPAPAPRAGAGGDGATGTGARECPWGTGSGASWASGGRATVRQAPGYPEIGRSRPSWRRQFGRRLPPAYGLAALLSLAP